jgi:hypothetical protein
MKMRLKVLELCADRRADLNPKFEFRVVRPKTRSFSGSLGFLTLSIVRYSKEHISETGSVPSSGEEVGDTYSVRSVSKS